MRSLCRLNKNGHARAVGQHPGDRADTLKGMGFPHRTVRWRGAATPFLLIAVVLSLLGRTHASHLSLTLQCDGYAVSSSAAYVTPLANSSTPWSSAVVPMQTGGGCVLYGL